MNDQISARGFLTLRPKRIAADLARNLQKAYCLPQTVYGVLHVETYSEVLCVMMVALRGFFWAPLLQLYVRQPYRP